MTATSPASDLIIAVNSGSSSLKLAVFRRGEADEELVLSGSAEGIGREDGSLRLRTPDGNDLLNQPHVLESQDQALDRLVTALQVHLQSSPVAVGHRFVHGGPKLREHQPITSAVREQLERVTHFAPLHIPAALRLVAQSEQHFPDALQVACFDTAFHRTLPDVASHLPVPREIFDQGIFRYGFHGLSYESIVHRLGPPLPKRAVFAHLGNGSSLAAVQEGLSIDTTMGLTPTGGVPMSTRSGDLDPGVLLYLLRNLHYDADSLEDLLNRKSGLAGLSNSDGDMQTLLQRSSSGDIAAQLAVDVFTTAIAKTIGAYAALLGGLDLLVFTGGIGEHSAAIRTRICRRLGFLGLSSGETATSSIQVLPAQEELQIARHCRRLLHGTAA